MLELVLLLWHWRLFGAIASLVWSARGVMTRELSARSKLGRILSLDAPTIAELQFGSLTSMLNIGLFLPYVRAVGVYEAFKLE